MSNPDYYKAPSQEIFNEIKLSCIKIWKTYDDTFGYATEKIDRIKDIENIRDNCLFMVAMFDVLNMKKLLDSLSTESRQWLEPFLPFL